MKKILFSLMAILLAVGVVGGGAFAIFQDVETVGVHDISAGTLDLQVGDNDPCTEHVTISNIAPGYSQYWKWCLKNTGSIPGAVSVEFSPITNVEGVVTTEPEAAAEAEPYTYFGAGPTLGRTEGELGEYLKAVVAKSRFSFDIANSGWSTGPPTSWGTWGLDALGGNTYDAGVTLGPGETVDIYLMLSLEENLRAWDGCHHHDIDDNIIQSDSVEFDIIFHLDQA